MQQAGAVRPFSLDGALGRRLPRPVGSWVETVVERALSLSVLDLAYRGLPRGLAAGEFARQALDVLGLRFPLDAEARIPREGPVLVLANHPLGAAEGVFLIGLLSRLRQDFRLLGNSLLCRIPEISPCIIPVDVFGGAGAVRRNAAALRQALRYLQGGGVVAAFPAGEVSSLRPGAGTIADRPWSPALVGLARLAGARIVPMHFDAANSAAFQVAGMLHPRLRTVLLPRELLNKRGGSVRVAIGHPLPVRRQAAADDGAVTRRLRATVYALGLATRCVGRPAAATPSALPVGVPVDRQLLAEEVRALPPSLRLAGHGQLTVFAAKASRIPAVLDEIGRLREVTFRAAGEGTGRARDLDQFDAHYEHLFVWNNETCEVAGAYRIGRSDVIHRDHGLDGFYTRSLFRYGARFLRHLGPALELGRSFVRAEYQRSYLPLMLLWKGIGQLVCQQPRYATLFGPASVAASYRPACMELLVAYLTARHGDARLARLLEPRQPFEPLASRTLRHELLALADIEELAAVMQAINPDCTGVPVLLRQYLKLGAVVAGFNVDPDFADSLDCMIVTDLRRTADRSLARYLGQSGLEVFRQWHQRPAPAPLAWAGQ